MKMILSLWLALVIVSAVAAGGSQPSPKPSGDGRTKRDRQITIINETGNQVVYYKVQVSTGAEIVKDAWPAKAADSDSFVIKIDNKWKNDLTLEVELEDKYGKVYVKSFYVPLEGTTDTRIAAKDRESLGLIQDMADDAEEWFDKHK